MRFASEYVEARRSAALEEALRSVAETLSIAPEVPADMRSELRHLLGALEGDGPPDIAEAQAVDAALSERGSARRTESAPLAESVTTELAVAGLSRHEAEQRVASLFADEEGEAALKRVYGPR